MHIDDTNKKRETPTQLNELFEVSGAFYSLPGNPIDHECRNFLRICRKQLRPETTSAVDATFIMMNPGGSEPVSDIEQVRGQGLVPAKPDDTQFQIMRLMNVMTWNTVEIINLSDYRATKSKSLFSVYSSLPPEHTIFHPSRLAELEGILHPRLIIAAWGLSSDLDPLSDAAIKSVTSIGKKLIGLKGSSVTGYLHPQPFSTPKQQKWILDMSVLLRSESLQPALRTP